MVNLTSRIGTEESLKYSIDIGIILDKMRYEYHLSSEFGKVDQKNYSFLAH